MNILTISDKQGSAIDRLAMMNMRRLPHLNIAHLAIHPKRPDPTSLKLAEEAAKRADIIDIHYWKSGVLLRQLLPWLDRKKLILTHNNEHNINDTAKDHWAWADFRWDLHIAKNEWQRAQLKARGIDAQLIRHACEFDNLAWTDELTHEPVVGYVGQIKKVKGVREIKAACDKLGYRLLIVGAPSEANYYDELSKNNVEILTNLPDDKLRDAYSRMRVLVCNSDDGTESGTLPILEAMASGIPVISRQVGHVRDFGKDQNNILLNRAHYTDVDALASLLRLVVENDDVAQTIRENAWRTVRGYHPERHARAYDTAYRQVLYPGTPSVSVIMPTYNRAEAIAENLEAMSRQTHENFEVVVCDDGSTDKTKAVVDEARGLYSYPIRYVQTGGYPAEDGSKVYGLAKARNLGIMEATGDILVFCDDRHRMHENAIAAFVAQLKDRERGGEKKVWCWGSKGAHKPFVENFSATWRRLVITGGMFPEWMNEYGGMTQEVSNRFGQQGTTFVWTPQAVCEPIVKTHSKSGNRDAIIRSKVKLMKLGL